MILIFCLSVLQSIADDNLKAPIPPTVKEEQKSIFQAFDTIIDMYIVSSDEEKADFMNSLDDYEIELFFEYLREYYPKEFEKIP
jgi:hypothetical protein